MKKLISFVALMVLSVSAYAQATANCIQLIQRNEADNGAYIRYACPPASGDGMLVQDASANLPTQLKIGAGLVRTGDTLSAPSPDLSGYASSSALSAGLSGKFNMPSGSVSEYLRGDGSRATFPAIPSAVTINRARITTASDGTYTWTYPIACPSGTVPVLQMTPEGSASITYNTVIVGVPTNTSASIKITQVTDVVVLTIHVLGIAPATATVVHLTAICP